MDLKVDSNFEKAILKKKKGKKTGQIQIGNVGNCSVCVFLLEE